MTDIPEPVTLASGEVPAGSWTLQISGTGDDMTTMLGVVGPDGRRFGGGLGGCDLPDAPIAHFHGRSHDRTLSVVCRTRLDVTQVRIEGTGFPGGRTHIDLLPVATKPELGLAFYIAVLPAEADLLNIVAMDSAGDVLAQRRPFQFDRHVYGEGVGHIPASPS